MWIKPKKGNVSIGRILLAKELSKFGYDIEVREIKAKNFVFDILRILKGNYDAIVGVVRVGAYAGFIVGKLKRIPIIIDVTDPLYQINLPRVIYRLLELIERFILKKSNAVIFVTKNYMKEMIAEGVSGIKVDNGVFFKKFNSPDPNIISETMKIMKQNAIDFDRINVLYVGSLKKSYNINLILDAAKRLRRYNFVLVGDGELKQYVKDVAERNDNVFYLGLFDHRYMPGFISHADICLCLVNADQPLKLLEYGAASKPVIAIHGELEDRFTKREVYFINPTVKDLCIAISKLVEDVKLRKKYGLRLRKRAERLEWSKIAIKYNEVIESVWREK